MLVSDSLEKRNVASPEWALAQRVVASPDLKTSPKLCKFFLYIVDCYLRDAPEDATEQQIGVHVFHRRVKVAGFGDGNLGYFPAHTHIGKFIFDHAFEFMAEFAYRIFRRCVSPLGGWQAEGVFFVKKVV